MANLYTRATKGLQNAGRTIARDYVGATKGLQNVGRQIASNVEQGQKNLQNKKMNYYGSINSLKGTGKAFMGSFDKGGKVQKTGLYKLHKGEKVVTKDEVKQRGSKGGDAKYGKVGTVTFHC